MPNDKQRTSGHCLVDSVVYQLSFVGLTPRNRAATGKNQIAQTGENLSPLDMLWFLWDVVRAFAVILWRSIK